MGKKPNKEEKEACDELQNSMASAQLKLGEHQKDIEDMGDEIIPLSDKAEEYNKEAPKKIEDQKSDRDMYTSLKKNINKINAASVRR